MTSARSLMIERTVPARRSRVEAVRVLSKSPAAAAMSRASSISCAVSLRPSDWFHANLSGASLRWVFHLRPTG